MDKPSVDQKRTVKLTPTDFQTVREDWPIFLPPGQAKIAFPDQNGCTLMFSCPGCGQYGGITVGFGEKPASPSWLLQGGEKTDAATWTLSPSIHCVGCCGWHGYLKSGVFEPC